jgi:hypothetical protein
MAVIASGDESGAVGSFGVVGVTALDAATLVIAVGLTVDA